MPPHQPEKINSLSDSDESDVEMMHPLLAAANRQNQEVLEEDEEVHEEMELDWEQLTDVEDDDEWEDMDDEDEGDADENAYDEGEEEENDGDEDEMDEESEEEEEEEDPEGRERSRRCLSNVLNFSAILENQMRSIQERCQELGEILHRPDYDSDESYSEDESEDEIVANPEFST